MAVCEKVLEAAVSVVSPDELSLETILHFIAALPREFTDSGGTELLLICFSMSCRFSFFPPFSSGFGLIIYCSDIVSFS